MPVVLDAAYDIGYAIGQVVGVLLIIGIPAGIGYVIFRPVRKRPDVPTQRSTFSYDLEPMMPERSQRQAGPCPACGNQVQPQELYCANCGRQLQPIP